MSWDARFEENMQYERLLLNDAAAILLSLNQQTQSPDINNTNAEMCSLLIGNNSIWICDKTPRNICKTLFKIKHFQYFKQQPNSCPFKGIKEALCRINVDAHIIYTCNLMGPCHTSCG